MKTTMVCEGWRYCKYCELIRPTTDFYKDKKGKGGTGSRCKDCHKDYREANKVRIKFLRTQLNYGVGQEAYEALVTSQENRCKICNLEANLVVDHCHNTRTFRGLICNKCNTGLGMFQDSPQNLRNAASYLEGN